MFGRPFIPVCFAFALFGCSNQQPAESADTVSLIRENWPGITEKCLNQIKYNGLDSIPQRVDQCFKMDKPRRWRGLWVDGFEGQQFCASPAKRCIYSEAEPSVWLSFVEGASPVSERPSERFYEIEFIGRRTLLPGHHGHMGMFTHEILVDRVISLSPVDTSPN